MMKKIPSLVFKTKRSNRVKTNHVYFKRRTKVRDYSKKLKIIKIRKLFLFIFFTLLSLSIIIAVITITYKYIRNLKDTTQDFALENVYGLDNISTYPNSEFIFKDNLDDQTVKNFLSLGYTVYRLPRDTSIEKVYIYYAGLLPKSGWKFVLSVPVSSEEKRYGEYWTKDGRGLRIYSRLNDIWYQQLTEKQAQTGLEDEVKMEVARKLLLLTSEKSDLLPDFPWKLSYPSEYSTKYYSTAISSFQGVIFQKIGSDLKVIIEPEGYFGATSFDSFIEKFLNSYNKKNSTKWKIVNSVETLTNGQSRVKAIITNGKTSGVATAMKNNQNTLVYVFATFEENDPFYDFVLSKIQSANPL